MSFVSGVQTKQGTPRFSNACIILCCSRLSSVDIFGLTSMHIISSPLKQKKSAHPLFVHVHPCRVISS